jgi:hypothetical protein
MHPESRRLAIQFISKILAPSSAVELTVQEQISFGISIKTVNLYNQHKVEGAKSK